MHSRRFGRDRSSQTFPKAKFSLIEKRLKMIGGDTIGSGRLFQFLLLFVFGFYLSESVKPVDYDFVEADELFANGTLMAAPIAMGENSTSPSFHPGPPLPGPYTASDSSIGYEVPCGVRGVNDDSSDADRHRIVGGIRAHPGEFPWQVSLQLISGWFSRHICGGTILSSYWVITAGHCVAHLKPQAIVVVAGDHDLFKREESEQRVNIVRVVKGGFSSENFSSDIALLQLESPLKLDGKRVAPICLPGPTKQYHPGEYGIVSGWGKLSETGNLPNILHFVKLPLITIDRCHQVYESIKYGKYINKCQLCCGFEKGGSDSCQGDSGGPLSCRHSDNKYYLCGIVSWGVGCARPNLPGVYTEVSCYSDWIKRVLYNVDDVISGMPPYK